MAELPTAAPPLRQRKRQRAMERVQRHAVALFEQHGFDAVSVEAIAAAAEVAPVSIYRWFGTKEGVVLWDDYDPGLYAAIADRLAGREPLEAVRDAVVAELDRLYDADRALVLARTRLIYREPQLYAASMLGLRDMQAALGGMFAAVGRDAFQCDVLAGVAVSALVSAIDAWQQQDGKGPLGALVREAFDVLKEAPWTA